MQLIVEYLVIIEKEATEALYHLCNNVKEFNRLLQANPEINVKSNQIVYKDSFECDYDIKGGEVGGKPQRYFHLKFAFTGHEDQIKDFTNLLRAVKRSIHNADVQPETLWDDLSFYYSEKAYPLIHQIESIMRKLIVYFMLTNVGKQWVAENLPSTLQDTIERSKRKQYLDVLHQVDFIDLGEFLFKAYPTQRTIEHLYSEIGTAETISDLNLETLNEFVPRSNWERYFSEIVECDDEYLKGRWEELYDLRCKIAHNAIVTKGDFERIKTLVGQVREKLQKAIDSLDKVHVPEDAKDQLAENVASNINALYGEFIKYWNASKELLFDAANSLGLTEGDMDQRITPIQIVRAFKQEQLITDELYQEWKVVTQFRNELVHGARIAVNESDIRDYIAKLESLTNEIMLVTRTINQTWKEEIASAIEALDGQAQLSEIYTYLEDNTFRELGKTWKATVRYTLQVNSVNTQNGREDGIFVHVDRGVWGLSSHYKSSDLQQAS